ncbi:MAG: N-acetylmuramoyl-L-alanine amidase [Clostridia bacterium]|nr:N-acetylmuramoyl-L-alanine amidase [Clostridia bacterium]
MAFVLLIGGFASYFIVKASRSTRQFTVVIDAGHGGIDGGASGTVTGVKEADINLLISKKLKELFENSGFRVVMTREDSEGLYGTTDPGFKKRDLLERVKIINSAGADFLISIHLNVYSSQSRRGAQAFFKKGSEQGKKLAKRIQARINGLGVVPRLYDALSGDYYLLNESNIPSVIVECGFLSSPEDEKLLLTEEFRGEMANAIFGGSIDAMLS